MCRSDPNLIRWILDTQRPGQVLAPFITALINKSPNRIFQGLAKYVKCVGLTPFRPPHQAAYQLWGIGPPFEVAVRGLFIV